MKCSPCSSGSSRSMAGLRWKLMLLRSIRNRGSHSRSSVQSIWRKISIKLRRAVTGSFWLFVRRFQNQIQHLSRSDNKRFCRKMLDITCDQMLIIAVNRRLNIHDFRMRTSVSILPVDFRFQAGNPYTRFSKKASHVQSLLFGQGDVFILVWFL